MVARMATYRFRVDPYELAKKAEEGLLPIFMKQPGFRDYSLFADRSEVHAGREGWVLRTCARSLRSRSGTAWTKPRPVSRRPGNGWTTI